MGPRPADEEPRLAFIVGAPRSGTTWLSRILGAHPDLAATYETHLFNAYLAAPIRAWRSHLAQLEQEASRYRSTAEPPRATIGLPYVLTDEEFRDLLHDVVRRVSERALAAKPGARVVVEKTPSHSSYVADIEYATLGTARYIHVIRDGYAVVDSLRRASQGWGTAWAPADARTAAKRWARGVRGARDAAAFPERYVELRYEDLLADPAGSAGRLFEFLEVDAGDEHVRDAVAATERNLVLTGEAAAVLGGHPPEPSGFRSSGRRPAAGARDVALVNAVAGDLLAELGYLREAGAAGPRAWWWRTTGLAEELGGRVRRRAGARRRRE